MKQKILLYDLNSNGHHPGYMLHVGTHLANKYQIELLVSSDFYTHKDIVSQLMASNCIIHTISNEEEIKFQQKKGIQKAFYELQILRTFLEKNKFDSCLIMYLDQLQIPLMMLPQMPCKINGIIFRVTLMHYLARGLKEKINFCRKNIVLYLFKKSAKINTIFTLDEFVVDKINSWKSSTRAMHLPDPVSNHVGNSSEENKGLRNMLIFGFLDGRKGIIPSLIALSLLPKHKQEQINLQLVGPWDKHEKTLFNTFLLENPLDVRIQLHDKFVANENINSYFENADLVLATYDFHVGMSAVLIRAALAKKPIIVQNYGLVGKIVIEKNIGFAIDQYDEEAYAKCIDDIIFGTAKDKLSFHNMELFAKKNTPQAFAEVIEASF